MPMSVRVEGLAELEREMEALSQRMGRAALRRAMKKAAEPLVEAARAAAPRDRGGLAASVGMGGRLNRNQARQHRKAFADDRASIELFVGASYAKGRGGRHAHLVEFGTGNRFQRNGRFVGRMPARPWLRPAWDANRDRLLADLRRHLWEEVRRAVANAERRAARQAAKDQG